MVIKMVKVKINGVWVDVVKLSDDKGKHSGSEDAVYQAKVTLGIPTENVTYSNNEINKAIELLEQLKIN
jgi:hypothetical protein